MQDPSLDLGDIQGDVLIGLQKDAENFAFFEITDVGSFKSLVKQQSHPANHQRAGSQSPRLRNPAAQAGRPKPARLSYGTEPGLDQGRPDAAFRSSPTAPRPVVRGRRRSSRHDRSVAVLQCCSVAVLHDPPISIWLKQFVVLTAAGYFFMPPITVLRTVLT
jgi:hypothetical protein